MGGLPQDLWRAIRSLLMDCDELATPEGLRALFGVEDLGPFRAALPEANTLDARATQLIGYLTAKWRTDGRNVLVVFLEVLGRKRDPADALHLALLAAADAVSRHLRQAVASEALSTEANPAAVPMIALEEVRTMLARAASVAKVGVARFREGRNEGSSEGTGWLIAPGLLATCWHVLEAAPSDSALQTGHLDTLLGNCMATFDYTAPVTGVQYGVGSLAFYDRALDYALLRLKDREDRPIQRRPHLPVELHAPLGAGSCLYIIQHPLGREQQLVGDRFQSFGPARGRILYRTPTEPGTSGAPVFNQVNWRVVAMHNGENQSTRLREGTLLGAILADVRARCPALHEEIAHFQGT